MIKSLQTWQKRWAALSLRQTLFLGASLGILLPALVLGYFQIVSRYENAVDLRVRAPMEQYADVLSRGMAVAMWNVDKGVADELVDAVMRNPDVVSVRVVDENQEIFVFKRNEGQVDGQMLKESREVVYNGARVGQLTVELTAARVEREFKSDILKLAQGLLAQVAVSFLFIWWLFNRRMMRPLQELQAGALRLARGELKQPLNTFGTDEIGNLAKGLDAMRIDLGHLLTERDQKNATLEHELAERKRTEEALTLSRAKFAAIFDASPVAMTVSKLGGEFTLVDFNVAWERLFAQDRALVRTSADQHNALWQNQHERQRVMETLMQTGEVSRSPNWMLRGEGHSAILCEVSGKVFSQGGEPFLILAYEDITEKQKNQQDILQLNATLEVRVAERTRELSEALSHLTAAQSELVRSGKMAALGALVAGIAHELNTPVGNSLMVASTMQDQAASFSQDLAQGLTRSRLEQFVAKMQDGASILMSGLRHAAELVASFKQVAVDQTSINRRRFDLHDTVEEILLTLGPSIRKTTCTVQTQIPAGLAMESFPGPLGQVITNLINNAMLHAFEGRESGVITISAHADGNDHLIFTVQDNGVGIPQAHLARVFDPFFTTKLGRGGSGLGLNIVYNLVHDVLGGSIHVDSPPGEGACFTMRLPLLVAVVQPTH
ncbi:ATP-binding protein [Rhodoferax aquaticus]|nr:ATP-binding protein [Rhodoferax aquaticus]